MKRCGKCKCIKPLDDFYWRNDRQTTTSKCKVCLADFQREYKSKKIVRDSARPKRAKWQTEKMRAERAALGDEYIKKLLVQKTTLSWSSIPDDLVQIKRLQIQIQRFIKEHHEKHDGVSY